MRRRSALDRRRSWPRSSTSIPPGRALGARFRRPAPHDRAARACRGQRRRRGDRRDAQRATIPRPCWQRPRPASTCSARSRSRSTSPARARDGRGLRRGPAWSCRSASTSASGRRSRSPSRCSTAASSARCNGFRSIYSERWDRLSGGDALSLRPRALRRRDDHRPHHPSDRSRPASRRRLRRRLRRAHPQRPPRQGRRQCLAARPLRLRRARLPVLRPLFAGDRRRHRHLRHRGDDPHRDRDAQPVPRRAACRLHREAAPRTCPTCSARRTIPTPGGRASRAAGSRVKPPRRNPYDAQLADFCASIREGQAARRHRRRRPQGAGGRAGAPICRCARGAGSTCRCRRTRRSSCRPMAGPLRARRRSPRPSARSSPWWHPAA